MGVSATLKNIYKGEKKYLKFSVKDIDGDAVDCTSATVQADAWDSDDTVLFDKNDGDFIKTDAATGVFKVEVTFGTAGTFTMIFQITFENGQIEKEEFELVVTDKDVPT